MGPGAALDELGEGCTWQRPLQGHRPRGRTKGIWETSGVRGKRQTGWGKSGGVEVAVTPAGLCVGDSGQSKSHGGLSPLGSWKLLGQDEEQGQASWRAYS